MIKKEQCSFGGYGVKESAVFARIDETVAAFSMLSDGCTAVLGFSGGGDSALLLSYLCARLGGERVLAVHVHHGIRGEEAERDARFAEARAREHGVAFHLVRADVPALAEGTHENLEETARRVRYEALLSAAQTVKDPVIVTAHNSDDNLETVLLHLVRGSGLRGLCGIAPVREEGGVRVVRPLIGVSKSDVLATCAEMGIPFVTDSTNGDTQYARNFIRAEILPAMRKLNPSVDVAALRMCGALRAENDFADRETARFLGAFSAGEAIPLSALCELHEAIRARVITSLAGGRDLAACHIRDVSRLIEAGNLHDSVSLPGGMRAVILREGLAVLPENDARAVLGEADGFCRVLSLGENDFPELGLKVVLRRGADAKIAANGENIYKLFINERVNFGTIKSNLFVRTRREGDTYLLRGMHRKVKKIFSDGKLPLRDRARYPLIADAEGIFWLPGLAPRDGGAANGGGEDGVITVMMRDVSPLES